MAKKQTARPAAKPQPTAPPESKRRFTLLHIVAVVAVVAAIAVFAFVGSARRQPDARPDRGAQPQPDTQTQAAPTSSAVQTAAATPPPEPPPAPPAAALGPHPQANLPLLPFVSGPPARPIEVVRAVYQFAAEHPEVASYVPCYCGCERAGHRGSEDCFVASRGANGDVESWEPHGMT